MRTWIFWLAALMLAGSLDLGVWAFGELAAPYWAREQAQREAESRGITWPLTDSAKNGLHPIWHFTYANPEQKSETVQITVRRDDEGNLVASLSEKDHEKWPKLSADSR